MLAWSVLLCFGMSDETPAGVPAQGGNKKLLIGVLVFNGLIAAGLGYQVVMGQKAGEAQAPHGAAKKAEAAVKEFGPIIEIGTLVANVGTPEAQRYIKITMHVEAADEEAAKMVTSAIVPIRSDALLYLSGVTVSGQKTQDKMAIITADLQKHVTKLLGKKNVKRVYFSEFVIQ